MAYFDFDFAPGEFDYTDPLSFTNWLGLIVNSGATMSIRGPLVAGMAGINICPARITADRATLLHIIRHTDLAEPADIVDEM